MSKQALKSSIRLLSSITLFTVAFDLNADSSISSPTHLTTSIMIPIAPGMPSWEEISFNRETLYSVTKENQITEIHASSDGSASGLAFKQEINIVDHPFLNWSWKIKKPLSNLPEEEKQGDDYAARIYVIVKDGWFFWQTKALNYVWSSRKDPPFSWPNAYAPDNTVMIPLKTASSPNQIWFKEKRNIYKDLKQWLGKDIHTISAIAIMTDADDSQQQTEAAYRNLYFSEQ